MTDDKELKIFLEKLETKVKGMFMLENSGHDFYHLERTKNLALKIQEKEGGNRLVIGISAFLHDVHRLMERDAKTFVSPLESLPTIQKIFEEINFPEKEMKQVLHCIEYHEEYSFSKEGKTVNDIETLILQDADNLDAIGAIGVARTFAHGAAKNLPMWVQEKSFDRKFFNESEKDPSTIHHFYSKLFKLKDNMNTKTGKKIAKGRHIFMQKFIKRFMNEWNGIK